MLLGHSITWPPGQFCKVRNTSISIEFFVEFCKVRNTSISIEFFVEFCKVRNTSISIEFFVEFCKVRNTSISIEFFVGCFTSQQASVSQGWICEDNFTCSHTEIEVADQTFYLTQSQNTDTRPTSPSADPIVSGAWQGSHWSASF